MKPTTVIFVLLSLLVLSLACAEKEPVTHNPDDTDSSLVPDAILHGATINLSDRGQVKTKIVAEKIVEFHAIDSFMAYEVDVVGFDSLGRATGSLIGDSAVIHKVSGLMDVFGKVVLNSKNGYKLQSEYLRWDSKTDRIETHLFVRITREEEWATGVGFEADQEINRFKILHDAKGTLVGGGTLEEL